MSAFRVCKRFVFQEILFFCVQFSRLLFLQTTLRSFSLLYFFRKNTVASACSRLHTSFPLLFHNGSCDLILALVLTIFNLLEALFVVSILAS